MEFVKDFELKKNMSVNEITEQMNSCGFQATQLGRAIEIIKRMKNENATIFLSFTSNMVASGLRSIFAKLAERKFIDVIITAGGSIDHDLIKSYKPYMIGDFFLDDVNLHKKEINRLGNILISNEHYILLEKKIQPILKKVYEKNKVVSPSELILEIGKTIKDKNSILYWTTKNKIPIFCPGITDSAIGLQVYFFKQEHRDFGIDVTRDMNELADIVYKRKKNGGIILGGGISKHHTIAVNIVKGGLNYAVYITTGEPWDGSLSGAQANEGVSWGKISEKASFVTVNCDVTVVFPLIASAVLDL
jgi:deoxyhypusine synthase